MCSSALSWFLTTLVLPLALALNLPMASRFGSDYKHHAAVAVAVSIQMLSVELNYIWFANMKVSHSMCGPHEDTA